MSHAVNVSVNMRDTIGDRIDYGCDTHHYAHLRRSQTPLHDKPRRGWSYLACILSIHRDLRHCLDIYPTYFTWTVHTACSGQEHTTHARASRSHHSHRDHGASHTPPRPWEHGKSLLSAPSKRAHSSSLRRAALANRGRCMLGSDASSIT